MKWFARWKLNHSKPVDEESVTIHLSEESKPVLCGIDKRFPDVYEIGMEPVELNAANLNRICGLCRRKVLING